MATQSAIVTRAVLVDLTISKFLGTRTDKVVTKKVVGDYNASDTAGRWAKRLFPQDPPEFRKVNAVANTISMFHRTATLPWITGFRMLPRDMHLEYTNKVRQARSDMEDAVKELVAELPRLQNEAKFQLGAMYEERDYPNARELREAFNIDVKFMPVPDVGDFRVALDAETMREVRAQYAAELADATRQATESLWERMKEAVEHLAEACSRPTHDRKDGAAINMKDAVMRNIRDLVSILPKLNVTDDAHLEAMRKEVMTKLAGFDRDTLKHDQGARDDAKKKADAILKKMSAFMGAK